MITAKTNSEEVEKKRQSMKPRSGILRSGILSYYRGRQNVDILKLYKSSQMPCNLTELLNYNRNMYN